MHHGETLHQALHRELIEEIGAQVKIEETLCMREIFNRNPPSSYLPEDFHQIEIFIQCQLRHLGDTAHTPDRDQIGHEWLTLDKLNQVLFFPRQLVPNIQSRCFPEFYLGEIK